MLDSLHHARLAMLEAALLALLHEHSDGETRPDTIVATLDDIGMCVEYTSLGMVIGGEGI